MIIKICHINYDVLLKYILLSFSNIRSSLTSHMVQNGPECKGGALWGLKLAPPPQLISVWHITKPIIHIVGNPYAAYWTERCVLVRF